MKMNKFLTTGLDNEDTVIVNAIKFREILNEKEELLRENELLKLDKINRSKIYADIEEECNTAKASLKETSDKLATEMVEHRATTIKLNKAILDKDTAIRKYNDAISKNNLMSGLLATAKTKKKIAAYTDGRLPIKLDLKA